MKKLLILTVAAIVCLIMGCKSSTEDYYPMSVGSQWDYSGYMLYGTTTPPTDTFQTMTVTTVAQAKTTLTSGEEVIPFQSTVITRLFFPTVRTDTSIGKSYVRESGDVILGYDSLSTSIPDTLMVMPLEANKTWHNGSNVIVLVVGQEDVMVAAGTYKNAWKIKYTSVSGSDTMETFQWYAKGVGAVKTHYEYTESGYNMIFNQELLSATIK
jgi:hypothetical protein